MLPTANAGQCDVIVLAEWTSPVILRDSWLWQLFH